MNNFARNYPSFDVHDQLLLKAGKATTCVIVEERRADGSSGRNFGTAFFVTNTHLLTAGHVVKCSPGARIERIRVSYAGCKTVDAKTNTIECNVVGNLDESDSPISSKFDLALLECPSQEAGTWLPISANVGDLQVGEIVDIVGYPADLTPPQKESFKKKGCLTDYDKSMEEAKLMLRPKTLTVSRGTVEAIGNGSIRYRLSSISGMSGACVMFNGMIYGSSKHVNAYGRCACRSLQTRKRNTKPCCFI